MFFLSKEWQDSEDGIEMVILRWTVSLPGRKPRWKRASQMAVMIPQPATSPVLRRCSMWVAPPFSPPRVDGESEKSTEGFLLYYFFECIQRGRTWSTEVSSQEIRAVTLTHTDPSAECPEAFLYYSLDEFKNINRVPMLLEGLPANGQPLPVLPDGLLHKKDSLTQAHRYERIASLPLPHTFHAQLWGLKDTRALYAVYF
ncbi:MAG: hypothetical protein ACRERD_13770, partial [Candidatus Binatia bacterium]